MSCVLILHSSATKLTNIAEPLQLLTARGIRFQWTCGLLASPHQGMFHPVLACGNPRISAVMSQLQDGCILIRVQQNHCVTHGKLTGMIAKKNKLLIRLV